MNKRTFSERDICTKFITPALESAGRDKQLQILEEVSFTDGKIYVRGKFTARGTRKRADYILYYKPNIVYSKSSTFISVKIYLFRKNQTNYFSFCPDNTLLIQYI